MAATFPASFDALTNPTAGSLLTSPSHSGQHTDANDILEAIEQRVGLSGSSFPGSPSSGQFFHHTTRRLDYYYDGTRWLGDQRILSFDGHDGSIGALTATSGNLGWRPLDLNGNSDIWLERLAAGFLVVGGTALGASHKWVLTIQKGVDGTATFTTVGTLNIDSGASDVNRQLGVAINALVNGGTVHAVIRFQATKTGTPGSLFVGGTLLYRMVG